MTNQTKLYPAKSTKEATDYSRAKNIHKYICPQSPPEKRAHGRSRANNKPKQIIARKAHKKGKSFTAGQRTYVNKTARKAHTKRGQTLRNRANNKSKQIIARKAHEKGK